MSTDTAPASASAGKYLTVVLAGESYGIAVLKVREIIRLQKITPVPQTPAFVKGIINLRGRVIPVVDLRVKFGLTAEFAERTCIVVVEVSAAGDKVLMGMVVDAVSEVINISTDELEETPRFGGRVETDYIKALAKVKGTVKILLDIDRVLTGNEFDSLAA